MNYAFFIKNPHLVFLIYRWAYDQVTTESEKHKMREQLTPASPGVRDLQSSFNPVCLFNPLTQECIQVAFEYPQGGRFHQLPGQSVPVFSHRNRKSVFWYLDDTLCVSVCFCFLLPCHWALRNVCLGLLYSLHSNVFTVLRIFLSLLFRLKIPSSFSVSSLDKCSSSSTIFVKFPWTLFRMSVPLILRRTGFKTQNAAPPPLRKGELSLSSTCWQYCLMLLRVPKFLGFLFVFRFCQELLVHPYLLGELLLGLEQGIVEYQPTFLAPSPRQGHIPWDSFR